MPNQKITISTILEEFENTQFAKEGGSCFECCDYEGMYKGLEDFITHALKQYSDFLMDSDSLEDKSNGRYNREIELRNKIKEFWEEK